MLDSSLTEMTVDAYTDDRSPPAEIVDAQVALRSLAPARRCGDPLIGIRAHRGKPEAWKAAQIFAAWSVLVELFDENGHRGSSEDGRLVTLRLSEDDVKSLAEELGDLAWLERT